MAAIPNPYWTEFIVLAQTILTEFLAACLGFLSALWLDRWLARKRASSETAQLATAILNAINKNIQLVEQLKKEMTTLSFLLLYPMDLTILDSTAVRKHEVLQSVSACESIDHARYELIHLDGKLRLLREFPPEKNTSVFASEQYKGIRASCVEHLPIVKEALEKAKTEIISLTASPSFLPPRQKRR